MIPTDTIPYMLVHKSRLAFKILSFYYIQNAHHIARENSGLNGCHYSTMPAFGLAKNI